MMKANKNLISPHDEQNTSPIALITGSAKRIGAIIAEYLHQHHYNIVLHYRNSKEAALALQEKLLSKRANSVITVQADLQEFSTYQNLIDQAVRAWGKINLLVHNASDYFSTPIGQVSLAEWDCLFSSNLRGPFFLSQAAVPYLRETQGNIINIIDINGFFPLKEHSVYCIAKAGLAMLTKSLAYELGPNIRVNAIAPGTTLWSDKDDARFNAVEKAEFLQCGILKRLVDPKDIAKAVLFLVNQHSMTGQIINISAGQEYNKD